MELLSKIESEIEKIGLKTEKFCENALILDKNSDEKILLLIGNKKNLTLENYNNFSKIIVVSPFVASKIDSDFIREALKTEEKIVLINKNSFEEIYPKDLIRVINYLKENPNSYIKKISKDLGIHPEKARRILLKLKNYLEVKSFENHNLPKLPKIVSLKRELTAEEIREIAKDKIKIITSRRKKKKIKYRKIKKEEALPLVLDFIEKNPGTHLREISRRLMINPAIVYYCLKEVSEFIEAINSKEISNLNLPNLPIQIKLKDGYNSEGILRVIKIKKMLNFNNSNKL